MSTAYDKQRKLTAQARMIHNATGQTVALHKADYDFLKKRKAIDSFEQLDGIPVRRCKTI